MPADCDKGISLVDSLSIITCAGRNRKGKVAPEITSKGYCSTKNMYYQELKLHALTSRREGKITFPGSLMFTPARDNDLTVFKQAWGDYVSDTVIFGDKIYATLNTSMMAGNKNRILKCLLPLRLSRGNPNRKGSAKKPMITCSPRQFQKSGNP